MAAGIIAEAFAAAAWCGCGSYCCSARSCSMMWQRCSCLLHLWLLHSWLLHSWLLRSRLRHALVAVFVFGAFMAVVLEAVAPAGLLRSRLRHTVGAVLVFGAPMAVALVAVALEPVAPAAEPRCGCSIHASCVPKLCAGLRVPATLRRHKRGKWHREEGAAALHRGLAGGVRNRLDLQALVTALL
eukprot:364606-Chlamydomonas_euryale.AAC.9